MTRWVIRARRRWRPKALVVYSNAAPSDPRRPKVRRPDRHRFGVEVSHCGAVLLQHYGPTHRLVGQCLCGEALIVTAEFVAGLNPGTYDGRTKDPPFWGEQVVTGPTPRYKAKQRRRAA